MLRKADCFVRSSIVFYSCHKTNKIVSRIIINAYKGSDLSLNFSFLHSRKDRMGKMNVKAIIGSQRNSKTTPTKATW